MKRMAKGLRLCSLEEKKKKKTRISMGLGRGTVVSKILKTRKGDHLEGMTRDAWRCPSLYA